MKYPGGLPDSGWREEVAEAPLEKELPALGAPFSWRRSGDSLLIRFELGGGAGAFSTRLGGVSRGSFSSLNVGVNTADDGDKIKKNLSALFGAIGRSEREAAMCRQQHGAHVVRVDSRDARLMEDKLTGMPTADGLVTDVKEASLVVFVADCLPVALVADGAVGMLHCGWRGLSKGIIANGVEQLAAVAGAARSRIDAVVGPGIGPCCYEVGREVIDALDGRGSAIDLQVEYGSEGEANNTAMLDLAGVLLSKLVESGVDDGKVHTVGLCTRCNEEIFFSHRRDGGNTGRQGGVVWRV